MLVLGYGYFPRIHGLIYNCNYDWRKWLPGYSVIRVPRRSGFFNLAHIFELSGLRFHSLMSLGDMPVLFNILIPLEIIITSVMYCFPDHEKFRPSSN